MWAWLIVGPLWEEHEWGLTDDALSDRGLTVRSWTDRSWDVRGLSNRVLTDALCALTNLGL